MKVVSIGGIANDGVDYTLWLEQPYSQPSLRLERLEREGGEPLVTQARLQALTMVLKARIWGVDEDETGPLREAFMAALDTQAGAVALVVCDDDDTNERYRYVVCMGVDEQPEGEGTGQHLAATLVTQGEPRWRANTAHEETWEVAASEETRAVVNGGTLTARPVYTIQPTDAKSSFNPVYEFRMFCAVRWTALSGYTRYPVELTGVGQVDGGWDTAALVIGGDVVTADNIGVVADGKEIRRWITDFDTDATKVWANLDFVAGARTWLYESMGSGDTISELRAMEDISGFPQSGILQIDSELFTYSDKDNITRTFLGVRRAAKGSTAAEHTGHPTSTTTAADIYWIQHDVWIVYGPTGLYETQFDDSAPDLYWYVGYDGYKPMIDLEQSWNQNWVWEEFGESGNENKYRPLSWRAGGLASGTAVYGDPYDQLAVSQTPYYDLIGGGESWWSLPLGGYRVQLMRAEGEGARFEFVRLWRVSLTLDGGVFLSIPEPVIGNIEMDFYAFDEQYATTAGSGAPGTELRILQHGTAGMEARFDRLTLTFDEESFPAVTLMGAEAMYDLALTLENVTTGESITLTLAMELDGQVEIDTAAHTVTMLDDGSSQYQALSKSTRRREVLLLRPGSNTLKVTEDGLAGVTVQIAFEERTYT